MGVRCNEISIGVNERKNGVFISIEVVFYSQFLTFLWLKMLIFGMIPMGFHTGNMVL